MPPPFRALRAPPRPGSCIICPHLSFSPHSVPDTPTSSLFLQHARHSPASGSCTSCFLCQNHSFYEYLSGALLPSGSCSNPLSKRPSSYLTITFYAFFLLYFSSLYLSSHVVPYLTHERARCRGCGHWGRCVGLASGSQVKTIVGDPLENAV